MIAIAISLVVIGLIQLIFPQFMWWIGTLNLIYNNSYVGREEHNSIHSLAKKKNLSLIRISGVILLALGIVFLILN